MKHLAFVLTLALPLVGSAAILPDSIGAFHRTSSSKPALTDQAVWKEYDLKDWERATFENGSATFTASAWRLADTTGSLAAFDWQRPADAKPSKAGVLAAETPTSLVWVDGNYLFVFEGYKPQALELAALGQSLKDIDRTALPILPSYLPADNLVPDSERYISGPAGLARFDSAIPSSVAGFQYGAEGQMGVFHSQKGDLTLTIFNYPTPQIAMDQAAEMQKLPSAVTKRSGPFVAVIVGPADPDLATRLLGQIQYQAEITRNEYVPTKRDNMGDLLLNICILIGILAGFALLSGLVFGGLKYLVRMARHGQEAEPMITLHLE